MIKNSTIQSMFEDIEVTLNKIKHYKTAPGSASTDSFDESVLTLTFTALGTAGFFLLINFPVIALSLIALAGGASVTFLASVSGWIGSKTKKDRVECSELEQKFMTQVQQLTESIHRAQLGIHNCCEVEVQKMYKQFVLQFLFFKLHNLLEENWNTRLMAMATKAECPGDTFKGFRTFNLRMDGQYTDMMKLLVQTDLNSFRGRVFKEGAQLFNAQNLSLVGVFQSGFIGQEELVQAVTSGYTFSQEDYKIFNKIAWSNFGTSALVEKLKDAAGSSGRFSEDKLENAYIGSEQGSSTTPERALQQTVVSIVKTTPKSISSDPLLGGAWLSLQEKIEVTRELELSVQEKAELGVLESKTLPEISDLYQRSVKIMDKDNIAKFLTKTIDDTTLQVDAIAQSCSHRVTLEAQAASLHARAKTLAMGAKK